MHSEPTFDFCFFCGFAAPRFKDMDLYSAHSGRCIEVPVCGECQGRFTKDELATAIKVLMESCVRKMARQMKEIE